MTIADFIYLCTEGSLLSVSIFGLEADIELWRGQADEIPDGYMWETVESFDAPENNVITITIA